MIAINRQKTFPRGLKLGKYAEKEVAGRLHEADLLMRRSSAAWMVSWNRRPMFLVGVYRVSFVGGNTRIWFVPFEAFTDYAHKVYKFAKRGLRRLRLALGPLSCMVDDKEPSHKRFVEALGFRWTTSVVRDGERFFRLYLLE